MKKIAKVAKNCICKNCSLIGTSKEDAKIPFFFHFMKVAQFISAKIKPHNCSCGESVAFNVPSVSRYIKEIGIHTNMMDSSL